MQEFTQIQQLFLQYLQENLEKEEPEALFVPINYILNLEGKRIRPALVLMTYNLFKKDPEKVLPIAFAVEIFHNFSLMHDDIMDQAPLRRGKPSVHEYFDTNTAILSGDAMLILAYKYLMQMPEQKTPELVRSFNDIALNVCKGQQYDMNFENRSAVSLEEYLKMIELKTAVLIAGSFELGAIAAGASKEDVEHLEAFGRNMGLAFQLQDDLLDTFGDPGKFGKKTGGDIAQNKKTFLIIKALEIADLKTKDKLIAYLSTFPDDEKQKIKEVTKLLEDLGIKEHAAAIKTAYQEKAFEHLAAVNVPEENKVHLIGLANTLLDREV